MSRVRSRIRMSREEIAGFLDQPRTLICATNGSDGWPHLMPLWYRRDGEDLLAWTYAKSQKVLNLRRDGRASLQVEEGSAYEELRAVMIKADVAFIEDAESVLQVGIDVHEHYAGRPLVAHEREELARQAPKRIGLRFVPRSTISFDHTKLADFR